MNKQALLLLCIASFAATAQASSISWNNPNSGTFQTGTNWNTGTPPGTADTAIFGSAASLTSPITVTFAGNVTNTALDVQDGSPSFSIGTANTYTITEPLTSGFSVAVGDFRSGDGVRGNATLALSRGTLAAQAVAIGLAGTGTLNVNSGAKLTNADTLSIGAGMNQTGTLNINSGGLVTSTNTTDNNTIGNLSGSTGTVNVTGGTWTTDSGLFVGALGTGNLNVSAGGSGSNIGVMAIGSFSGITGTAMLTGAGTSWTSSATTGAGQVNVGDVGIGFLTVTNGATLSSAKGNSGSASSGIIGFSGGTGTATISAGGSWTQNGALRVGFGSGTSGTLNILSGGTVSSVSGSIGYQAGSTGTALVSGSGSSWMNTSTLDIGTAGTGTLTVANGGTVSGTTITIGSNGTLNSAGGTLTGNVVNNGGVVLGDAPGDLTINGSYTNSGTLTFLIAGESPADYSQLFIKGAGSVGTFSGTIDFDFIDGFAPMAGDTFDFIMGENGGTVAFPGATYEYTGLAPGYQYSIQSSNGPNGSFDIFSNNNGTSTSATPEPGAFLLVGTGLIGFMLLRRRHRNMFCTA